MRSSVFPVVLGLILGGCVPSADKKEAMEGVLSQRLTAKALLGNPRNLPQFQTNSVAFLQALKAIDATRCPKDFREAWSDYVAIVQRSASRFLSLLATNAAAPANAPATATNPPASPGPAAVPPEAGSSNRTERLAELDRQILVFQGDIDKAWMDLKRVAKRYGIEAER